MAVTIGSDKKKKEIYTYEAPWTLYGLACSQRPDQPFRFAVGSFIEEYCNKVQVRTSS
jgi:WD repeat-containing protein 68